ncbi:MAG TPA: hypothetical protein VF681_00150 [Abditibacteriaceae bacterium]
MGNEPWKTWLGDRAGFSILFKGERFDFKPTDADYQAAGIVFKEKRTGPDSIDPGCLFRFLCHHLNHPFFAEEAQLRSFSDNSTELEVFIQTRHWHHPVYMVDADDGTFEDDYICNIPCFQILARAIASGDLAEWSNQDSTTFNTHWESLEAIRNAFFELMKEIQNNIWICLPPEYT